MFFQNSLPQINPEEIYIFIWQYLLVLPTHVVLTMYSMSFFLLQNTNWGILKNAGIETKLDPIDFHWIDKKKILFVCSTEERH